MSSRNNASVPRLLAEMVCFVEKIFCRTTQNEDEKLFSILNRLEFRISRTLSMSRIQLIERVIIPEVLTHFLKGKDKETNEQAIGRFYRK